jgi:hypothetical protein
VLSEEKLSESEESASVLYPRGSAELTLLRAKG